MTGWRPWATTVTSDRCYTRLDECLKNYLARIQKTARKKTIQSYTTVVNILNLYLSTLSKPPVYANEFTTEFCCDFLDWLISEREVTARTRNNYLTWLYTFSKWMKTRNYISSNPAEPIERLKEQKKQRKSLTDSMLKELFSYLQENDPNFLLAVMMEYYTFIRPQELHYIRICDIRIKEQKIYIPAHVSKNGRDGFVALNKTVIMQMLETGLFNHPDSYYIFGKDFKPSPRIAEYNLFSKKWETIRKHFGWSNEYKFYSLKDSGIRDLANSEGIVTARDQARHTDISTTNKYLEANGAKAPEGAKAFKGNIG